MTTQEADHVVLGSPGKTFNRRTRRKRKRR